MRLAAVRWRGPGARLACACMLRGCEEVLVERREEEELEGVEGEKVWSPLLCEAHLLETQLHRRTEAYRAPQ